ncbi:MAG: hypothetical protein E7623_04410 [Ruminococcaceae bacterium]|nr:hypothetical protein [Oscillospiraceae bacterium]
MRNLTIKREKSFVGSLAKMKVYIEDPTSNEICINDISCRKIGDLKNGEEKTFQIDEQEAKIYVIADKLSKNYCNEFYQLPAGQEDVFLSGKNKFNPANGNAFRFDNNESEETIASRKRGARKGLLILIVAPIVGAVIGYSITSNLFSNKTPDPKDFSSNGMTITLTDEFVKTDVENYTVAYDSKNVVVFALKEAFTLAEGFQDYTLEQYGNLVLQNNNLSSSKIGDKEGLIGFEYEFTNPDTKDTYKYFSFVYKSNDAFWLVQFATLTENVDEYSSKIIKWAKTISFE